jgi:hypothetical protein
MQARHRPGRARSSAAASLPEVPPGTVIAKYDGALEAAAHR